MIINISKTTSRGKLHVEIETKIKPFYSHDNELLTDEKVMEIARQDHEIQEMISRPDHKVGNYLSNSTKQKGTWVFKLVPVKASRKKQKPKADQKPLTKTSLRSKINKIAKELNEEDESTR